MGRRTLDKLLSTAGLIAAICMLIAGGLLAWAASFANTNVHDQLAAQRITMPSGQQIEDPAIKPYLEQYAGQEMTTGDQAKAYADHYIQVHMDKQSQGRTYEEVSGEYMKLVKDPSADQAKVKELGDLRQSLFMGNSLRGLLLEAYAFGTMGKIAQIGSWVALLGGLALLALSLLGFRHAKAASDEAIGSHRTGVTGTHRVETATGTTTTGTTTTGTTGSGAHASDR